MWRNRAPVHIYVKYVFKVYLYDTFGDYVAQLWPMSYNRDTQQLISARYLLGRLKSPEIFGSDCKYREINPLLLSVGK